MRASVIIPNLDSPWIGRTLEALAAQGAPSPTGTVSAPPSDPRVEVLVVGKDRPGLVPRGLPGLTFLDTGEPVNPAAARNRGVAAARGERLLFTDADCRPLPGWIEGLLAALDTSPVAGGAVTFPMDRRATNRWALADNIASFHELLEGRPAEAATAGPLGSLNLAVRRDAWDRLGGFDEELTTSEDLDWVLRARAAGLDTAFVPGAVVEHAAVRADRRALEDHARWYGSNLHDFRRRHPRALATGPTWESRERLARTAPLKALTSSLTIFLRHRRLLPAAHRAFPGVVAFKRAWYRAVLDTWPGAGEGSGEGNGEGNGGPTPGDPAP